MSFFYELNKKLDSIRATPEVTHQQLNERDMGKHNNATTGFKALAAKTNDKIAGAQFQKMKKAGQLEEQGQLNELSPELLKKARDRAGEKWADADDRKDKKASAKHNAQDDKFNSALRKKTGQLEEEGFPRIQAGIQKYTQPGIEKLAKLGREGASKAKMDATRKKYNQYDNEEVNEMYGPYDDDAKVDAINAANPPKTSGTGMKPAIPVKHHTYDRKDVASNISGEESAKYDYRGQVEEGPMDTVKKIGKRVASGVNRLVGHGSDEDMRKDVQRKAGVPQTGKKPEQKTTEAAKYRDPKYKDKLYTQEPPDYTYGPDMDDAYDNPKPDDYAGRKRKIGGGEFPSTDPLERGQGIGRSGIKNNILDRGPRKGLPSRDQISSLKGSIKSARGTHAEPNLPEAGAPMTTTGKKLNFADKIASAKKEVDEMLGDVAAEAMRSALGGGKGRNAEMDEERSKGTAFDMSTPRAAAPKAGSTERGAKHDIKHSTTDPRYKGRIATRRTDAQGNSVDADDASDTHAEPRGRGRPKGTTGAIGAKGPSGKSKLMTKEGADQGQAQQVVDDLAELRAIAKQSQRGGQFPQGFASQLEVVLYAAITLIRNQQSGDAQVREEEKTSTRDDRAEKAGKRVTKDIEYDEKKKDGIHGKKRGAEDAKAEKSGKKVAKDIEHDEKKKEKEVDESTTSGSVATSTATKSSKGSMVGKGIYDSFNRELENMIAESMTINMSDSTEGGKSLTITATDEDALKLGMLLKNAGLGSGDAHGGDMHSHGEEPCATCGMPDCGCDDVQEAVDENSPDYPTNTEQANNNFGYAGGLDGPKSTGQSTVPVLASQDDRQHSYAAEEEDAIKRMMEMAGLAEAAKPDFLDLDKDGNKKESMKDAADNKEEDTVEESIRRMMEIAGVKKKPMDEEKTDEGNFFAHNVIKAKEAGKKEADLDGDGDMEKVRESIFALNNQWRAYKG